MAEHLQNMVRESKDILQEEYVEKSNLSNRLSTNVEVKSTTFKYLQIESQIKTQIKYFENIISELPITNNRIPNSDLYQRMDDPAHAPR
jgi:hypothetical protein